MADKQTTQRSNTTTQQGRPAKANNEKTPPQNRKAKFYGDVLNCRLRELMDGRGAKTEELARVVGIGSSAVRMWYTGYARPDIDKIPIICKFYGVSADWLLGLSDAQSMDMGTREISEKTGLSDHALLNLFCYSENQNNNKPPNFHDSATAAERLWFINNLIEDEETLSTLADNANLYVNFTQGEKTANYHAFMCQKYFLDFVEGLRAEGQA